MCVPLPDSHRQTTFPFSLVYKPSCIDAYIVHQHDLPWNQQLKRGFRMEKEWENITIFQYHGQLISGVARDWQWHSTSWMPFSKWFFSFLRYRYTLNFLCKLSCNTCKYGVWPFVLHCLLIKPTSLPVSHAKHLHQFNKLFVFFRSPFTKTKMDQNLLK